MENEEIEKADSEIAKEQTEEVVADTTTEEVEEPKFTDAERRAFARAKVAEAKVKDLKAQLEARENSKTKSDGLDLGAKAFLTANGIKGAKEFEFVQSELKRSGEELDSLLENDYFKTRLEKFRELGKTAEATPTGKRSAGSTPETVEYWMTKPFEEVPANMRRKVVQAKLDQEKNKGKFYNS